MRAALIWVIVVIVVLLVGYWYWDYSSSTTTSYPPGTATSTPLSASSTQTTSDGVITFSTPADFGLAATAQQLPMQSNIPSCASGFTYCLYYSGTKYQGTNFESAGLAIVKRDDLLNDAQCLNTPPAGFTNMQPDSIASTSDYSTSVFSNVSTAAAGHTSSAAIYRLFVPHSESCYEFQLQIGESQYANYPAGSMQQFTDADKTTLGQELMGILYSITLANGETVTFPQTQ